MEPLKVSYDDSHGPSTSLRSAEWLSPPSDQCRASGDVPSGRVRRILSHVLLQWFGTVFATSGFAYLWILMGASIASIPRTPGWVLLGVAMLTLLLLVCAYALKMLLLWQLCRTELRDPHAFSLLAGLTAGMLLISAGCVDINVVMAEVFWWISCAAHSLVVIVLISGYFCEIYGGERHLSWLVPSSFIAPICMALIPLGAGPLGYTQVAWMSWGVGAFFFVVLYPLIFLRVAFVLPLLRRRRPQLFIFLGACCLLANGYFASVRFEHGIGALPNDLVNAFYGLALFMALLIVVIHLRVGWVEPSAAYWTYVFPLSALAAVTVNYYLSVGALWCEIMMWICVGMASVAYVLVWGITLVLFVRWMQQAGRAVKPQQ